MAKLLNLRWGVADDPTALQPSLHECLATLVAQSDVLVANVIEGLVLASAPQGLRRNPQLQRTGVRQAIEALQVDVDALRELFRSELSQRIYQGGGQDQVPSEALRFDDLQMLDEAVLDRNIEQARAQQEVERMVDDVLPALDALVSTLLGWRTAQPGLNPVRPQVFVAALQATLWSRVPDPLVREVLVVPSAGLLGSELRKLYREMADWLGSTGVEPAVPVGGRKEGGSDGTVSRSVAKTLLTLDRLRKLLAGDFDAREPARVEFLHTVPASLSLLQELKQEDELLYRLERERAGRRSAAASSSAGADMLSAPEAPPVEGPRLGRQLGEQVVRLMFDNLANEGRLVAAYKQQLRTLEPAVLQLARDDSRFFSDRAHPARQLLERMTQRSLAFSSESDAGWQQFLVGVERTVQQLVEGELDAERVEQVLAHLQADWDRQDADARLKREEAARALVHAEQRNLLAQRLAAEFEAALARAKVPEFIADFLKTSWSQAVAEDQLRRVDGSNDPRGLRAVVDDLVWSVKPGPARGGRLQRLAQLVPGLVARLREGLRAIDYPTELTERFLDRLHAIHASALKDGRDVAAREAAREAETIPSEFGPGAFEDSGVWLASQEAEESGYLGPDSVGSDADDVPQVAGDAVAPRPEALRIGAWVELRVQGQWQRVQLTWASPHQTLFMFTSPTGTAHSMSRRTLERLHDGGRIRVVAGRNLVDEALDQVAKAALRNSLGPNKP